MNWTRCAALGTLASVLAIGAACTNSGLGGTEDTGKDATGTSGGGGCPWEGTWSLAEAACGSFLIGNWEQTYSSVTLTATAGDGGCALVVDWSGDDCGESETMSVAPVTGGGPTEFTSSGITSCAADGCTFDNNDDVGCETGDRANTTTVAVDDSTAGRLVFTGFAEHAWTSCTLDFVTTWNKL